MPRRPPLSPSPGFLQAWGAWPGTRGRRPLGRARKNPAIPPVYDNTAALDLLTIDEVATMLKTSRKAIYHRVARGQIPAVRLGRSVFIRRGDLADCLIPRVLE